MRGLDEADFREIGSVICGALGSDPDLEALAGRSVALCEKHPLYPGLELG